MTMLLLLKCWEDDFFQSNGFISYVYGCLKDSLNKEDKKEKEKRKEWKDQI